MDTKNYTTDIDYTYDYCQELSSLRFKFACLLQGIKPPKIERACELGYGNGISININAATSGVEWWGTDFNVSHANFASDLALESGNGAKLYADSFEDFLNRSDLPDFDFIVFHGIYSWVDQNNRDLLLKFVDKKLKIGGGVYASYNIYPGFSELVPFRNLLKKVSDYLLPKTTDPINKIDSGFELFDKLASAQARFIHQNPNLTPRVEELKKLSKTYLIHEFLNDTWEIMDFMDISKSFSEARLKFVSSADVFSVLSDVAYTPEQKALLNSGSSVFFREYMKDLIGNNSFRRDYWIKGSQKLSIWESEKLLKEMKVVLIIPKSEVKFSISLGFGTINLSKEFYSILIDILGDNEPRTIGQIQEEAKGKFKELGELVEGIAILYMMGALYEVQDEVTIRNILQKTHQLNKQILEKVKAGVQIPILGSALIGKGIAMGRFKQLFFISRLEGKTSPEDYAKDALEILERRNEKIIKDGKILETKEENFKELQTQAIEFEKNLSFYRNLKFFQGI
ncbi:hypothetical protein BKH41_02465 [Helicobacter sp. 12S02232-10]|uniref:class I SAM-dependent methyltransferase n=1 Tax=Helicobacter sp. 12S02232-10 TaxID=1476197 RepID=UPI000BA6F213|nr:methyltransferase regulatory domain-containing protein [Helicobacter sp. 12S02232-10]PAF49546.1 hypothetical protein BKH41_02465 [Helicobacter sp. 12S02232-10]